jgi:hypothetical protein
MNLRFPIAVVAAGGLLAASTGSLAAQEDNAPEPPVEATREVIGITVPYTTEEQLAWSAGSIVAQEEDGPQPPVEFTACVQPGPEVARGTDEQIEVAVPDGEMTIERSRGYTWRLRVSDVSDPRLDGTWYTGWDGDQYVGPGDDLAGGPEWAQPRTPYGDQYVGPGDDRGPEFVTFTDLIVNDDGAWQGSAVVLAFPDDRPRFPLVVLIGEGAYEGLTAVVALDDSAGDVSGPCPNTRGYIIEGSVPAPPVLFPHMG